MSNAIYVIGFHRAGTHSFTEHKANEIGAFNIEEHIIDFNDMKRLKKLKDGIVYKKEKPVIIPDLIAKGFVCQCPMASAWAEQLAEWGQVYWVTRNHEQIITSMCNGGFNKMMWDIVRTFRKTWPDDPLWNVLEYDGSMDFHYRFVGYATLTVKVKQYFYDKYLKQYTKEIIMEEQPYYDSKNKALSLRQRLRPQAKKYMDQYTQYWENLSESLCMDQN